MEDENRCILSIKRVTPLILGVTLFISCSRNIEKVAELPNLSEIPAAYGTGMEIIYSDSAIVRIRIEAPELKEFPDDTIRPPQIEFPQGLTATFFNQFGEVESVLTAKNAVFLKKEEIFEARNQVVVRNFRQDQELLTDLLYWDRKQEKLWSDQPVIITTPDGTTNGSGFTADQNFTRYAIGKPHGSMKVSTETSQTSKQ